MDVKKLTDDVAVAGQITVADIDQIVEMGFRGLICNRPDGEAEGQPDFADIEAAAKARGLVTRFIPIVPGIAGNDEVDAMADALEQLPVPILAYCRSGARSTTFCNAAFSLKNA